MILHQLYTSSLRAKLRALGITRLLQTPGRLRNQWRRCRYSFTKPTTVSVRIGSTSIRAHVENAFEFQRVLAIRDDAHLIRALTSCCAIGAVVWDVGANVGLYSIPLAQAVGAERMVVAFEPEPRSRSRMEQNLALNGVATVTVKGFALGRERSKAILHFAAEGAAGTHSMIHQLGDSGGGQLEIDVYDGDTLVANGELPQPNVLKIDVEGAEEDVIDGLRNVLAHADCTAVLCEVHFAILAEAGRADAPSHIAAKLAQAGLRDQRWLDASHLLAVRA
ncbi:MAG: FkbM family methyltransferase [Proteobacteria bacterium]|nr:FkbM family methyltransferase [Pseudomonadota bacterium]